MLELLRKHQHGIMIVVAFIVIVAFAWFFNPYDTRSGSLNQVLAFRVGNEGVTMKELDRQTRLLQVAEDLGFTFTMQLLQPTFDVVEYTQNRIILGKQARKLGIDPTEAEVQRAIAEHPEFRPDGSFSEDRYLAAIKDTLEPNGLVAGDLRELVADKLRLEKLTELLTSGVAVPPSVVDVEFQREREKIAASVIGFEMETFKDEVEITDADLQAYYDKLKAALPSEERRVVSSRLTEEEQAAVDLIMAPEKRKAEFVFLPAPVAPAAVPSTPSQPAEPDPPLLLQPGVASPTTPPNPGGALTAPPLELNLSADPSEDGDDGTADGESESEPPGQAPALEDGGGLEIEPLPELPGGDAGRGLTPAEDLASDVNVGGLNDDETAPDLGAPPSVPELDFDLSDLDVAPELTAPPVTPGGTPGTGAGTGDQQAKMREYLQEVDRVYMAITENPDQFRVLAEGEGLEVQTTPLFPEEEPPAAPVVPPALVTAIFRGALETDRGVLVPVEGLSPRGYYLARLVEVEKSSEFAFEDVKEEVREALVQEKAIEKMEAAAKEAREKLVSALEAGKSFDEVVTELGLEARQVPSFSLNSPPADLENASEVFAAVRTTTTGSISEMQRAGDDALLVYVSQRVAASETKEDAGDATSTPTAADPAEQKRNLGDRLESQAASGVVQLWLQDRRDNAKIDRYLTEPRIYFPSNLRRSLGF